MTKHLTYSIKLNIIESSGLTDIYTLFSVNKESPSSSTQQSSSSHTTQTHLRVYVCPEQQGIDLSIFLTLAQDLCMSLGELLTEVIIWI